MAPGEGSKGDFWFKVTFWDRSCSAVHDSDIWGKRAICPDPVARCVLANLWIAVAALEASLLATTWDGKDGDYGSLRSRTR